MNIEKIAKKITKKNDLKFSDEIPISYIFHKGIIHILGLFRALFKKKSLKGTKKRLFIGKKVNLFNKSKITIGNNVRIEDSVTIDALSKQGVFLGDNVKIGENSKIICTGSLSELGIGLVIDKNTSFAENAFFGAAGGIEIGKDVIAGQNVRFHAENHNFDELETLIRHQGVTRKGIRIGNNVWIGAGVVFLDGCEIDDGCVIAANSVVNKKFPKNSIIAGCPAKIFKERAK